MSSKLRIGIAGAGFAAHFHLASYAKVIGQNFEIVAICGSGSDRAGWGLWQITCGNSVPQYGTDFQILDPWNNAEAAVAKLGEALEQLRAAGLAADGSVGNADPILAVTDAWDPKRYDEIIVSTLPSQFSKWLHAGLPDRIGKLTDAPVTHIVSQPPKPEHAVAPPPAHPDKAMGPLSVLAWGARKT